MVAVSYFLHTADEGVGFLASGRHEGKDQARGLCSVISEGESISLKR